MGKKAISVFMAMLLTMSLGATAFASEHPDKNIAGEPVDRSGEIVRVDIPNGDGTFTTLEGAKAQAWYDRLVTEEEGIETQNMTLEAARTGGEIETRGAFRYRYLESKRTNDVERRSLDKQNKKYLINDTNLYIESECFPILVDFSINNRRI